MWGTKTANIRQKVPKMGCPNHPWRRPFFVENATRVKDFEGGSAARTCIAGFMCLRGGPSWGHVGVSGQGRVGAMWRACWACWACWAMWRRCWGQVGRCWRHVEARCKLFWAILDRRWAIVGCCWCCCCYYYYCCCCCRLLLLLLLLLFMFVSETLLSLALSLLRRPGQRISNTFMSMWISLLLKQIKPDRQNKCIQIPSTASNCNVHKSTSVFETTMFDLVWWCLILFDHVWSCLRIQLQSRIVYLISEAAAFQRWILWP